MRVAVLGAGGMLGRAVVEAVGDKGWTPLAYTRTECDITNVAQIHAATLGAGADAVINCAGIVPGRGALTSEMIAVNAMGPWLLAECIGGRLPVIHVSTDCVFSGHGIRAGVGSMPDTTDTYGRSKLLGEADGVTVVRTSFIGPDHGLLAWLMESAARGEPSLPGWTKAMWSGSTVWAVAWMLVAMLDDEGLLSQPLHHLATECPSSKADVLAMCKAALGLDIEIVRTPHPVINRAMNPTIMLPPFKGELDELEERCASGAR